MRAILTLGAAILLPVLAIGIATAEDKAAAPTLARNGPGVNTWNQLMVGTMYGDVYLTGDVPDDVMVSSWKEGDDVESGAEHWWLPFDVATGGWVWPRRDGRSRRRPHASRDLRAAARQL